VLKGQKQTYNFWVKALNRVVYLIYGSPTKALKGTKPKEAYSDPKTKVPLYLKPVLQEDMFPAIGGTLPALPIPSMWGLYIGNVFPLSLFMRMQGDAWVKVSPKKGKVPIFPRMPGTTHLPPPPTALAHPNQKSRPLLTLKNVKKKLFNKNKNLAPNHKS
jgi:hypothetical protein